MAIVKKINMTNQIMIAMVLGIVVGLAVGPSIAPIKIFGDIFLNLIQMSVVVLVMGAVIEAVGDLDAKGLGKLGMKMAIWFMASTFLAAALGIVLGYLIQPGTGVEAQLSGTVVETSNSSLSEIILGFFPTNIIESMANANMIQVIVFAVLFGLSISIVSTKMDVSILKTGIKQFNVIILRLVGMVMVIAPIGIFALIASTIANMGLQVILPLLKYLGVYALGTFVYLIIWLLLTAIFCRVSFFRLAVNLTQIAVMALVTTSSAVTLPTALKDAREKLGIEERVSKLVLPLGMTLNSNGSAMHMAITVVTIAQIYGVDYSLSTYVYIAFLAALASLANAVVPGAGLVSLAIVVPQMNLPVESIALFAGVEWFVGMLRTILNVTADTTTALLVAKTENAIDYDIFNNGIEEVA
mgnify:CR=1 FL=1